MKENKNPKLRSVDKVQPPYPLNEFPKDFPYKLGREIVYFMATRKTMSLEGSDWEQIFALCIGAEWKPSNVGLDDILLSSCAWSAKTVKASNPTKANRVRLISGRNSPTFSYGESDILNIKPDVLGGQILSIWNERVSAIRAKHAHLRSVILIKSNDLQTLSVFEFETVRFDPELYEWKWNKRKNLEGRDKNERHCFTWQPHGSQFTIIEDVADDALVIKIRKPLLLDKEIVLKGIGFDKSWITILKKNG